MNKRLEQLEIQKLLQEYSFLLLDGEYKQEVIEDNREEFLNKIREARGDNPPPPPSTEPQQQKKEDKIDPNTVDKSTKDKIKKLYREIAKITHPDKAKTDEHIDLYIQATTAAEGFDLFALYEICSQLNITHSIDNEDKDILKIRINKKRDELKSIESSFIWLYTHAQTEEEKEKLINHFINTHG